MSGGGLIRVGVHGGLTAYLTTRHRFDTEHPSCRYLEVGIRCNNHGTLPSKLRYLVSKIQARGKLVGEKLTSRVVGVSVLAAASATILPTTADPV